MTRKEKAEAPGATRENIAEAVAYRFRVKEDGPDAEWRFAAEPFHNSYYEFQPLYTTPQAPVDENDRKRQRAKELIADLDARGLKTLGDIAKAQAPVAHVEGETFQSRVQPWMMACFGPEISSDRLERGDRLLEEVFELLQSGDYPMARVAALSSYVWSRPKGEPGQEAGGVMVTMAAYCLAHELDMHEAGEIELARIWTKVEKIRAKQAAKPTGSALPIAVAPPSSPAASSGEWEGWRLVPVEPTEAMLATQGKSRPDLAKTERQREIAESLNASMRRDAREIWQAMLAASPLPVDGKENPDV